MRTIHSILLAGMVCVMLLAAGCTNSSNTNPASSAVTTAIPATSLTAAVTPAAPVIQPPTWAGSWNTTWLESDGNRTIAPMTLAQADSEVTGTYSYWYAVEGNFTGTLNATVTGKKMSGTYHETDNDTGLFSFELADDGNAFTGRWVHLSANQTGLANSTLFWNGVRNK